MPSSAMAEPWAATPLVDRFGRLIENLRVSLTDRCNFRCVYCMPEEGLQWLASDKLLTFDEIERIVRGATHLGVSKIRLTGGEPTLRPHLPELIARLAPIPGLRSLSLTTNGFLLDTLAEPLAMAGLTRINVSLDSLDAHKFHQLTRRDALRRVLRGLEILERFPSITPIKVNAVAMRGFTEDEVLDFAELARRKPYVVRFIEFMPLDADQIWRKEDILTGDEIRSIIQTKYPLEAARDEEPGATAVDYHFADGAGTVGFINPVSHPFCATCNRIRLTADGQLRTCLFSLEEIDLRAPLRAGASDADIAAIFRRAVARKELKHHINDTSFRRSARSMSQIGG